MQIYLVPLLVGFAVFMAMLGVRAMMPRRQRVDERLEEIRREFDPQLAEAGPTLTQSSLPAFWRGVAQLGWVLPHLVQSDDLQWRMAEAGIRRREARGLFVGAKVLLAALLGVVGFGVTTQLALGQEKILVISLAAVVLGFYLPNFWLARKVARRRENILDALPDALDLMVICVEAGQGLNAAILTVGQEMELTAAELAAELRLINHEIRAGYTRAQSLRNFAWRTGVEEARSLVAVLVQSDRLGTSVAKALRTHADSMRTRRRQRAEEAARKTAVKLVFPLVFCIFPELLVVILAPGFIKMVRVLTETSGGS